MYIGGFQKNSLIDFPGAIACVVFTGGCNFICPYCHNPDLAAGPVTGTGSPFTAGDILAFLKTRKTLLDGVVFTGGEPTLQPDLEEVIVRVRELGFRIKLDSNGSRPDILARLLDKGLVDYLAMDIKTGSAQYPDIMKGSLTFGPIRQSIALIMEKAPAYEFRTTCVRPFVTEAVVNEIAGWVEGAQKYVLQKCSKNVLVLDPQFFTRPTPFPSDDELIHLKSVLDGKVKKISIR